MKGNKINGILWLIIALFLTCVFIRGMNGKNWMNLKFWTWNNQHSKEWVSEDNISPESEDGYVTYTFAESQVQNLNLNSVSSSLKCIPSANSDEIKIMISDNVNVRKLFEVSLSNSTLTLSRKPKVNFGFIQVNDASEILVYIPETVFESIEISNVSGKIFTKDISARKMVISNVSGKIEAENLQGKLKLNNVSGKISYRTDALKNNINAETVSGKIEILLPEDSDFLADYETLSGSVNSDFQKNGRKEGTIKNGDQKYDLHLKTVSGNIAVNNL